MALNIVLCVLVAVSIAVGVVGIVLACKSKGKTELSEQDKKEIISSFNANIGLITQTLSENQKLSSAAVVDMVKTLQENMTTNQAGLEKRVLELMRELDERMRNISKVQEDKLEAIRQSTERQLKNLQEDNGKQLEKMRETVDEKLSKTINQRFEQSFKMLSDQLESVYKSLGEMQNVASDVGNLTKMLSNVKTTGVFGEIQLGAIFDQLLTKDQYDTNVVTADVKDPVEYAIKLPGQAEGEFVYLPVDSKFPFTVYSDLQTAYSENNFDAVKTKKEKLKTTVRNMAKDIKTKYIYPPKTTNFAVMFLPVEGLYAEVAKMGLIEELQEKYNVTIAGPTTMSALLNSLQMGFRTLALQKKSGEVWKVLGAVRTEFERFNKIVEKIKKQFDSTSRDFDDLVGTRTRILASKLKSVDRLDAQESAKVLGIDDAAPSEE